MKKYLIIVGRFNDLIGRSLLVGATSELSGAGILEDRVDVTWVPGSFEMPLTAKVAAQSNKYEAIVCIGAVIKGETPHFDYVCGQAASGIMSASLDTGIPIIFGILTTNTVEEALNRSGLKHGNKGSEAARAAMEMVKTLAELQK